jgi:hypothetical protein
VFNAALSINAYLQEEECTHVSSNTSLTDYNSPTIRARECTHNVFQEVAKRCRGAHDLRQTVSPYIQLIAPGKIAAVQAPVQAPRPQTPAQAHLKIFLCISFRGRPASQRIRHSVFVLQKRRPWHWLRTGSSSPARCLRRPMSLQREVGASAGNCPSAGHCSSSVGYVARCAQWSLSVMQFTGARPLTPSAALKILEGSSLGKGEGTLQL